MLLWRYLGYGGLGKPFPGLQILGLSHSGLRGERDLAHPSCRRSRQGDPVQEQLQLVAEQQAPTRSEPSLCLHVAGHPPLEVLARSTVPGVPAPGFQFGASWQVLLRLQPEHRQLVAALRQFPILVALESPIRMRVPMQTQRRSSLQKTSWAGHLRHVRTETHMSRGVPSQGQLVTSNKFGGGSRSAACEQIGRYDRTNTEFGTRTGSCHWARDMNK